MLYGLGTLAACCGDTKTTPPIVDPSTEQIAQQIASTVASGISPIPVPAPVASSQPAPDGGFLGMSWMTLGLLALVALVLMSGSKGGE